MDLTESSEIPESTREIPVLAIECFNQFPEAGECKGNIFQTGDVVEEITIGGALVIRSPFKNGKKRVQKHLHISFKMQDTSIKIRVRRGRDEFLEVEACLVPNDPAGEKQYMLKSSDYPGYNAVFVDRTEGQCLALQDLRRSKLGFPLSRSQLQYLWEKKMKVLLVRSSSDLHSILVLPKSSGRVDFLYNDLDDTIARANAWLQASQDSGIPILLKTIQIESLLSKISGWAASSTGTTGSLDDLSNDADASLHGVQDIHGVDIGVMRAVRLLYAPIGVEYELPIKLKEGDSTLGVDFKRTEEGFIYIYSVVDDEEVDIAPYQKEENETVQSRKVIRYLLGEATKASKLLVVSRICNLKVLPWKVSSTGAIQCFNSASLSHELDLLLHCKPIGIHLFMWKPEDYESESRASSNESHVQPSPPEDQSPQLPEEDPVDSGGGPELRQESDTLAGQLPDKLHGLNL